MFPVIPEQALAAVVEMVVCFFTVVVALASCLWCRG